MSLVTDHGNGIRPEQWRDWVSHQMPEQRASYFDRAFLATWADTNPEMRQPALDHHLIVLHQGGPKRVERTGGQGRRIEDVATNSSSTVESGSVYRWRTEGPIAFAHIYIAPDRFAQLVGEAFDRDPAKIGFAESLGRADPHIAQIFDLMIASRHDPDWSVTSDFYLDALMMRLATTSTSGAEFRLPRRLSLTPRTIVRVREFIRENIAARVTLDDLAEIAGYSRFHFVRAFRETTGLPPYAFLMHQRIAVAQDMLARSDKPISEIADETGFKTHAHFSARFREATSVSPLEYRRRARFHD